MHTISVITRDEGGSLTATCGAVGRLIARIRHLAMIAKTLRLPTLRAGKRNRTTIFTGGPHPARKQCDLLPIDVLAHALA